MCCTLTLKLKKAQSKSSQPKVSSFEIQHQLHRFKSVDTQYLPSMTDFFYFTFISFALLCAANNKIPIDDTQEAQVLKALVLGEEERGQSQYQVMCFVTKFQKGDFITSDAMAKLRQVRGKEEFKSIFILFYVHNYVVYGGERSEWSENGICSCLKIRSETSKAFRG